MRVTINGTDHGYPRGPRWRRWCALTERTTGVAVAVNDEVIARGAWDSTLPVGGRPRRCSRRSGWLSDDGESGGTG